MISADLQSSGRCPDWKDLFTKYEIEEADSDVHDLKITDKMQSGPGDLFGLRDLRYFITSPEMQEITSSFSQTVGSKEGISTRSSMVNTDEKYEFKLLAMLESSVKTSSQTFNDTKLLVPLRLRLT